MAAPAPDRAGQAAAERQVVVGGVHDGVDLVQRQVALLDVNPCHFPPSNVCMMRCCRPGINGCA
jgi:hypothetical protein